MGAGQSKVQMWDERTKQNPKAEDKVERGGDRRSDIKSKPMMRRQEAQITGRVPVKLNGIMMPMSRDQSGVMGTGATGKGSGSERAKGNGR